ncbi:hypothetical protein [Amnibacterium setariae]|uniref:DUF4386 family protein n=1 Tax=Amnibacterium setariae TaxID=2306585 RepID=A0A3A1TVZ5_9MICO|nr:hypothetical protein [Amnibacterium setariae]RIX27711.1 hypothetical protein D1781_09165 [Amnibacterium setariae]
MTDLTVLPAPPATARPPARRAVAVLFVVLLISLVGRLAFAAWEGPFDGALSVEDVTRPGWWPLHLYLAGPAYALSFLATALMLVLLTRASWPGILAGLLVAGGGLVFALAITAEALPFVSATDHGGEEQRRAAVAALNEQPDLLGSTILGASAVIAIGSVLGLVAVWIARTTPGWFPPTALVVAVLSQLAPSIAPAVVGYVLQLVVLAAIGWFGWTRSGR